MPDSPLVVADKALYLAKERGRNRVTLHGPSGFEGPEPPLYKRLPIS